MPDIAQPGAIRTEIDGRIFRIVVDNVAKRNAFTPAMMNELSEAFTAFDRNDELWVAVLALAGEHTTAGLDMPKFFGPNREHRDNPPDPNKRAPVVVIQNGEHIVREDMLWGFPKCKPGTNFRTLKNSQWKLWLDRERRCIVPASAFAEPDKNTPMGNFGLFNICGSVSPVTPCAERRSFEGASGRHLATLQAKLARRCRSAPLARLSQHHLGLAFARPR